MKVKFDIIDSPLSKCKFSTVKKKQNVIFLENVQNKPMARPRNTFHLTLNELQVVSTAPSALIITSDCDVSVNNYLLICLSCLRLPGHQPLWALPAARAPTVLQRAAPEPHSYRGRVSHTQVNLIWGQNVCREKLLVVAEKRLIGNVMTDLLTACY